MSGSVNPRKKSVWAKKSEMTKSSLTPSNSLPPVLPTGASSARLISELTISVEIAGPLKSKK